MTAETYSVAELTRAISYALEDAFADDVWITGEISGLNRSRGHVYFDLVEPRDDIGQPATAQLAVALFKMNKEVVNRTLKRAGIARIDSGARVRIRGAVAFNERNGRLQVRMTGIDPMYTLGQLAVDRERVLRSLGEAGLLDRNARVPLPLVPLRVGLVTSAGSAAYHDFVHELDVSGLAFQLTFVDAKVQGVGAVEQVIRALRQLARTDVDVIALVRGGGSRADLATFDDEQLARTIAALDLPVLTGVGHEVDRSIADDVAHTAYKTPTACAAALGSRNSSCVTSTTSSAYGRGRRRERHDPRSAPPTPMLATLRPASPARPPTRWPAPSSGSTAAVTGRPGRRASTSPKARHVSIVRRMSFAPGCRARSPPSTVSSTSPRRAFVPSTQHGCWPAVGRSPIVSTAHSCARCARSRPTTSSSPASATAPCAASSPSRATPARLETMAEPSSSGIEPSVAPLGYAAAMSELEDLLADLEDDALDIDLLATKVERASELIRFCRSRINAARVQVDRIVADLENLPDEPATDPAAAVDEADDDRSDEGEP